MSLFFHRSGGPLTLVLLLLQLLPASITAKAIMGIDLGSLYMKVALVQRGSPLEIVTNLHSKRKTEVMVLFDNGSRFYGADASSLIARKPQLTPTNMKSMLGRDDSHPVVQALAKQYIPLVPTYNATRHGVCLTVGGTTYTPEELVAMVLNHARDISVAFSNSASTIRDCVLTVPSFYTQHERVALRDAAELAGLNVLALLDEVSASALNFGMDRVDEEPKNYLFYNLGGGALQVSVVTYHSYQTKKSGSKLVGSMEVRGKGWDSTLGGASFDALLVEHLADEFNKQWNKEKDIRDYPRPMTKLRLQANKAKHVLSANTEMPIYVDSLYDDTSLVTTVTRSKLEELSRDLFSRATKPIEQALRAANMTLQDIDAMELIGGGMRVPKVQQVLQDYLGKNLELGLHINSDESMALGAAFHGANVSTAFKVRQVGMTDRSPFAMSVALTDMPIVDEDEDKKGGGGIAGLFGIGKTKKEEVVEEGKEGEGVEAEAWKKEATIFKVNSKVGTKKTIAFTHDTDIQCTLDYLTTDVLPDGTETSLGRYEISGVRKFAADMEAKGLGKPKVSLQFELDSSGITSIVKAEAVVEEMVMVQEDVWETVEVEEEEEDEVAKVTAEEVAAADDKEAEEPAAENKEEEAEATPQEEEAKGEDTKEEAKQEGDADATKDETDKKEPAAKEEKKPKTKKVKKTVEKEKKKLHKRPLTIKVFHANKVQPYSDLVMEESKAKLAHLDELDQQRILLEEAKNKVESYIYHIKNKMTDDEDLLAKVTIEEQRTSLTDMATAAEDWMYEDGYDADLATYQAKYKEMSTPAEAVFSRAVEHTARPDAVASLKRKLVKVEDLMAKWETEKPQVTAEERADVLTRVGEVRTWLDDMETKQAATPAHETPVFTSAEVPLQTKKMESLLGKLSKRPKPKVEKKEENETSTTTEGDETESTESSDGTDETKDEDETKSEDVSEEEKKGDDEL